jgi:hypothetical protein
VIYLESIPDVKLLLHAAPKGTREYNCLQVKMSCKIERPKSNENFHTLVQNTNPNREQSITLYSIFFIALKQANNPFIVVDSFGVVIFLIHK